MRPIPNLHKEGSQYRVKRTVRRVDERGACPGGYTQRWRTIVEKGEIVVVERDNNPDSAYCFVLRADQDAPAIESVRRTTLEQL
jgi:hypothetical protein